MTRAIKLIAVVLCAIFLVVALAAVALLAQWQATCTGGHGLPCLPAWIWAVAAIVVALPAWGIAAWWRGRQESP